MLATCSHTVPGDPGTDGGVAFSAQPLPVYWRGPNGIPRPDPTPIEAIVGASSDEVVWPKELHQNVYFRRQGNPAKDGDDTIGDFDTLRQLRTDLPGVQNALISCYQYLISRFDADGFRIDTLRYLKGEPVPAVRQRNPGVRASIGKRNFFTFGEVLDADPEDTIP
jgi:glycosidase